MRTNHGDGEVTFHGGPPAYTLAILVPVGAIALVAYRASSSGLSATADDPVSPWLIAALTVLFAFGLGWRALTQRAVLGEFELASRNMMTGFTLSWDRVDRLEIVRRPGLVVIDVHLTGLRRRHRIGAATRFSGFEADAVVDMLAAHPRAGALLVDPAS